MFFHQVIFFLLLTVISCGKNETSQQPQIDSIKMDQSYLLVVGASPNFTSYAVGIVTDSEKNEKPKTFFTSANDVIAQCLGNNILIAERYKTDSLALYNSKNLSRPKWQVSTVFDSLGGGTSNVQSIESWSDEHVVLSSLDYSYLLFLNLKDGSLNTSLTKRNNFAYLDADRTPDIIASRWIEQKFYVLAGNYLRSGNLWSFKAPHLISFDQNGVEKKVQLKSIINPNRKMISYEDDLLIAGQGNLWTADFTQAGIVKIDENLHETTILKNYSIFDWALSDDDLIFISYLNFEDQELMRLNLQTNELTLIAKGKFSSVMIANDQIIVANTALENPSLEIFSLQNFTKIRSQSLDLIPQQVIFCQN
jgi:hypothetical protein